jgi:hypothetical protein
MRVHRSALGVLSAAADSLAQEGTAAEVALNYDDFARACLRFPGDAAGMIQSVLEAAEAGLGAEAQTRARQTRQILESTVGLLGIVRSMGTRLSGEGAPIRLLAKVEEAAEAVRRMRDEFAARWPWPADEGGGGTPPAPP